MDEFFKMDIFFVISALAVLIVGAMLAVALFYVIRILRNVDEVSERVAEESGNLKEDLAVLRRNIHSEGAKIKHFSNFFATILKRNQKKRTNHKV